MSYGYRFSAWIAEMLLESALFMLIITVMSHIDMPITPRDIAGMMIEILTFFGISGYLLTTLVTRLVLPIRWLRGYSIIAPLLFLAHFQVMNLLLMPEGLMDPHNRLIFRAIGSGVVIVVVTAISLTLERLARNRRAIKS